MKSVIITGASDGIGRAIAHAFSRRGYKVGLVSRRRELLEKVALECKALGAPVAVYEAVDVTLHDEMRASLLKIESKIGVADIFIANAGVGVPSDIKKDSYRAALKIMNLNVIAAIDGIEFFKEKMVERKNGVLVGVSSVAGARGLPGAGIYCASKAALGVYLEALRAEVSRFNVQVIDIAPGFIDTEMTKGNDFHMPFLMKPEVAGEIFCDDIIKGKPRSVAPRVFRVIRYFLKMIPGAVYDFLLRFAA